MAIQETFKNNRKIFGSLQDNPGLVKLQERYLGPSGNQGDFKIHRKIFERLQDSPGLVNLQYSYLGLSDNP